MMKFRGRFSFPKFDQAGYTKALEDACEAQIRQAAREWLRAVIPKVPVYTGTARGSLQPLGRFLRVAIPISPIAKRRNEGPSVGEGQGKFKFERIGHRFVFSAGTGVAHFIINNFYQAGPQFNLTNPTPWKAFEAGDEAFKAYIKGNLKQRLPKVKEYIRAGTKITGG